MFRFAKLKRQRDQRDETDLQQADEPREQVKHSIVVVEKSGRA